MTKRSMLCQSLYQITGMHWLLSGPVRPGNMFTLKNRLVIIFLKDGKWLRQVPSTRCMFSMDPARPPVKQWISSATEASEKFIWHGSLSFTRVIHMAWRKTAHHLQHFITTVG